MAVRSRKRDKKITLLKPIHKTDSGGFGITEWVPIPGGENIWAYYRQMSSKEYYAAYAMNIKTTSIFEIAWRNDLDTRCQIRYNGRDYDITRVDDFEGYKRTLKIEAYTQDR